MSHKDTDYPKGKRGIARFFIDPSLRERVEALHPRISTKKMSGNTFEMLVGIGLALVTDPSQSPEIPADAIAARQKLGLKTRTGSMSEEIENQGKAIKDLQKKVEDLGKVVGKKPR